jgi:quercetin dioxygenase-like cupin family protein
MSSQQLSNASLPAVFLFGVALAATPALAQSPAAERALAHRADDPQLQWSPCPPLCAKGCEVAVLHGNPEQGRSDIFFRVPANYTIPPHWHTSPEHMVLVSGERQVTYQGQDAVVLTPGTYAYGPAKAPHKAQCADAGPCVLFIAFESPIDANLFEGTL